MTSKKQPIQKRLPLCLCGQPAYRLKCSAPVCKRCDDIERRAYPERKSFSMRKENVV